MTINLLKLENFRNWGKLQLDLAKTSVLVGPNGIGKTNIIEALWLLSSGRSWRMVRDEEVIRWGSDFSKITAQITREGKAAELELILQKRINERVPLKQFKINGVKKRLIELLGKTPAALFSPETIQMIDGPPQLRRRFLDILLSQTDKKYALCLLDYARILRGRNRLLFYIKFGQSKEDELEFWDQNLATLGKFLIQRRKKAIIFFNQKIVTVYQEIAGTQEKLSLAYKQSIEEDKFHEYFLQNRRREIEKTLTLGGPHRDDLEIILDDRDITTFGSRGEYRSAVLALKILELEFLAKEKEERPVLLLDDIFSELDKNRRMHLAKIVSGQQTIITTTDLDQIERGLREKAKIIELK